MICIPFANSQGIDNRWWYIYINQSNTEDDSTDYVWRSRGRHEPGSGDYAYEHYRSWGRPKVRSVNDKDYYIINPGSSKFVTVKLHPSERITRTQCYERLSETEVRVFVNLCKDGVYLKNATYRCSYSTYRIVWDSKVEEGRIVMLYRTDYYLREELPQSGDHPPLDAFYLYRSEYYAGRTYTQKDTNTYSWEGEKVPIHPDYTIQEKIESGLYLGLEPALAAVYTDALTSLPHTAMNNIANIMDIINIFKMFQGDFSGVGNVSDAWMAYRYQYKTTMVDINDAANLLSRLADLIGSTEVRSNSVKRFDDKYLIRCSVTVRSDDLRSIQSFAEKWGVQLSAYNAWDMVPYSFIVDWFLDIGGKLEFYEGWNYALKFHPSEIWYSIQSEVQESSYTVNRYYRWRGSPPNVAPSYTQYNPGSVTLIKRATDLLCMVR